MDRWNYIYISDVNIQDAILMTEHARGQTYVNTRILACISIACGLPRLVRPTNPGTSEPNNYQGALYKFSGTGQNTGEH
ncbi:hypothetical protein GDO81_006769 [Engystomops pustulosus]|uniref:Uncharacterized protein n=1 Tax=Engystomops pustulosus TaxID=76066 RepID=A0AAV7CZW9_ENGPU|nr:hypothetical protein GDO81_006769 [Engystomops pustulosus]